MNSKTLLSLFVALAVAVTFTYWLAFRGYGKVSDNAYQLAMATYGACMAKDESRLEHVQAMLADDEFSSGITDSEEKWLQTIINQARNDEWAPAAKAARRMMEDQIES